MLTASGCAAAGRELGQFFDVAALGAVVTKSIMLDAAVRPGDAADGRDAERHAQLDRPAGPGHRRASSTHDLPWLHEHGARAVVSIAGGSVEEYAELAGRLRGAPGLIAVEVNISCPNVDDRGLVFACDPGAAAAVVGAVRAQTAPSRARCSPSCRRTSPTSSTIARACVDAGADGLSMINTLLGMALDPDTMRPVLAGVTGGLSGPAIKPVAVRCVWQVHAALPEVPILGHGRRAHRPGRARAHPGRRQRGVGRHGGLRRPGGARRGCCAELRRRARRRAGFAAARRRRRPRPPLSRRDDPR